MDAPHYFTKTITNLIKNYGLGHSLVILNSCLSDDDGHTLSIFEVDETINTQYLKQKRMKGGKLNELS